MIFANFSNTWGVQSCSSNSHLPMLFTNVYKPASSAHVISVHSFSPKLPCSRRHTEKKRKEKNSQSRYFSYSGIILAVLWDPEGTVNNCLHKQLVNHTETKGDMTLFHISAPPHHHPIWHTKTYWHFVTYSKPRLGALGYSFVRG